MLKYLFPFLILLLASCSQILSPVGILPLGDEMITIESPHGFEIFFDSGATHTARDYYISGSTVINGSYFGVTDFGAYYPAGLWESRTLVCCGLYLHNPHGTGVHISTSSNFTDPNLSHVVGLSTKGDLKIFPREELKRNAGPYEAAFQAGPLVLSGGILQDSGQSWHANESHERTLIGQTKTGKVYFFVSRKQISLMQAGEIISNNPIFQSDPITVLNLDGGPSTAFFDGIHGFRENKKLPIFFRINR